MTSACDTMLNPFIGSECGKRGKVVVNRIALFTPLKTLTIIPKERPFIRDWSIPTQQEETDIADIKALRDALTQPESDIDFESVQRELDL